MYFIHFIHIAHYYYLTCEVVYLIFLSVPKVAVETLDRCLREIMGWMTANKLKLNQDKMEALLVGPNATLGSGTAPMLDTVSLPMKAHIRNLNVHMVEVTRNGYYLFRGYGDHNTAEARERRLESVREGRGRQQMGSETK